jgi:proteasome accessory factor B
MRQQIGSPSAWRQRCIGAASALRQQREGSCRYGDKTMSRKKLERQLNLAICLMATTRHLSVDEISDLVPGYVRDGTPDGESAFRRMFERDKSELRELGIPVETGGVTGWDDEIGYRIQRRDYAIPDLHLTPEEAAALGLAARLWSSAALAEPTARAMRKLRAAGIDPLPPPAGLEPRVEATEAAFEPCLAAVREGRALQFSYRRPSQAEPSVRTVHPWGIVSWRGRWYLVGHDLDRQESRVFRLSRMEPGVRGIGPAGAVTIPPDVDLRAAVEAADPAEPAVTARVRLRPGSGWALRRAAVDGDQNDPGARDPDVVTLTDRDLGRIADRVVELGSAAQPVDSQELAAELRKRLLGALEAHP